MELIISIVAIALAILGFCTCIVPVLPGVLVAYAGYFCLYFCEGSNIGLFSLICYGFFAVALTVIDFILPSYFSKKFGGTKAGRRGATLGMIVGILAGFVGPIAGIIGVIVGPFAGAVLGEYIHDKSDKKKAFKVGLGAFISFFVGTVLKVIYAIIIFWHMLFIVWRIAKTEILNGYDYILDWLIATF